MPNFKTTKVEFKKLDIDIIYFTFLSSFTRMMRTTIGAIEDESK